MAAAQLRFAGSLLPIWFAADGDSIITEAQSIPAAVSLAESLDKQLRFITPAQLRGLSEPFAPWGWSRSLVTRLNHCGYRGNTYTAEQLSLLRHYSSRSHCSVINASLPAGESTDARTFTDPAKAMEYIAELGSHAVVKLPWSSSGRGILATDSASDPTIVWRMVAGSVKRQGCVTIERKLNKVLDCAALFTSQADGKLHFEGFSVFHNSRFANYAGNIIAPQNHLRGLIEKYVGAEYLHAAIVRMQSLIEDIYKEVLEFYRGWIGVDMLVHSINGGHALATCIEVNLRSTMGMVAMKLAENHGFNSGAYHIEPAAIYKPDNIDVQLSPTVGRHFHFIYTPNAFSS